MKKQKQSVEKISNVYTRMYTSNILTLVLKSHIPQAFRHNTTDLMDKSALNHMSLEDKTYENENTHNGLHHTIND